MRTSIVKLAFFSFLLIIQTNLFAQLIVTNNGNAQTLVPSTFVGTDVTVSNITYAGQPINLGSFNCSTCNFGLSEGLILSTGNPSTASGVASVFASSGTLSNVGDADLTTLAGATTYDRCVIEFDVVAINNKLEMQFQFASEEYDEYVGSFSDPMAIWISGPGITGSQNIALVPLTVNPININTINNGQTWSGLPAGPCTSCAFYHTNFGGTEIAFDGYTTVLTASKIITPGNTYHIKIAVADASDAIYDSAILLGKNSLRSVTAAVGCAGFAVSAGNDTIMCGGNPHLTATPAIAGNYLYSWSPSSGLNDSTLQNPNIISTISNMSYVITVTDSVNGCVASDTVNVSAYLNQIDTVNVCDFSVPLTLDATSPGAFSYDWGGGIFTTTNLVSAAGVYTCTITNSFGCTITHTFNVFNNGFMVDIGPDFTDCNQHSLNAQVIGGGNYVYSWSPDRKSVV